MQTNTAATTSDSQPAPGTLDPDLLALADPAGEVLMAVEPPTFVQLAAVPVEIGVTEPGS